jgi:hypothetical protein
MIQNIATLCHAVFFQKTADGKYLKQFGKHSYFPQQGFNVDKLVKLITEYYTAFEFGCKTEYVLSSNGVKEESNQA